MSGCHSIHLYHKGTWFGGISNWITGICRFAKRWVKLVNWASVRTSHETGQNTGKVMGKGAPWHHARWSGAIRPSSCGGPETHWLCRWQPFRSWDQRTNSKQTRRWCPACVKKWLTSCVGVRNGGWTVHLALPCGSLHIEQNNYFVELPLTLLRCPKCLDKFMPFVISNHFSGF